MLLGTLGSSMNILTNFPHATSQIKDTPETTLATCLFQLPLCRAVR